MAQEQLTPEQQIETLKAENKALAIDNGKLKGQNTTLTSENQTLKAENSTLKVAKEKAEADLQAAAQVVTDLKKQIAETESFAPKQQLVKVGKDTYELVTEFFFDGREITYELLLEEPALVEKILKAGLADLRKVSK